MKEISKELLETIKWIPKSERQSKWYDEYLIKLSNDLRESNIKE